MQQLATLALVKAWIPKLSSTDDDPLLTSLLARASGIIMAHISRSDIAVRTVTETLDGQGSSGLLLREWPVVSISSLSVNAQSITEAANALVPGYVWSRWDGVPPGRPQSIAMRGRTFATGSQNITVAYRAGYLMDGEVHTINAGQVTTNDYNGAWCSDQGVTYSDGTPFVRVTGAPVVGQYKLGDTPGTYTFNALDNNDDVLISYGYVPAPLGQACVQLIGEWYRYRQHIGQKSTSLDGKETASFDNSMLTNSIKMIIQPYRRVI